MSGVWGRVPSDSPTIAFGNCVDYCVGRLFLFALLTLGLGAILLSPLLSDLRVFGPHVFSLFLGLEWHWPHRRDSNPDRSFRKA